MLRCATWLAPGLPLGLFEAVANAIGVALATDIELSSFTHASGPAPDDDPFARDELDLGFLCTPSYLALAKQSRCSVVPVAAPVFCDARNNDAPVYFAELVVRGHDHATSLRDLRGTRIGYNDDSSLSGWTALTEQLAMLEPDDINAFATLVCTGGHRKSLAMLEAGTIDAASIDSNTLLDIGPLPPGLRVLETWGPLPVQPVVVRAALPAEMRDAITAALTNMHDDLLSARRLGKFNVRRFALVSEHDYR